VGSMADLSGVWDNGSQLVSIAQDGQNLTITVGGTSQSYLLSGVNVFLVQGNNTTKVAVLDHEVLRWVNGTTWEQIDLAGLYSDGGSLARIQQRGSKLWLVDGSGKFSIGQITSTGNISAANFGLTGTIGLGKIGWSNGTTWTKVALAGLYTVNGKAARVIQD